MDLALAMAATLSCAICASSAGTGDAEGWEFFGSTLEEALRAQLRGITGDSYGDLRGLEILNLSRRGLVRLPDGLCNLSNLRILNLSGNAALAPLPDGIARLINVEILDLSRTGLEFLPEGTGRLAGLRILILSKTRLESLPDSIGGLGRLEYLYLDRTRLRRLPASIVELRGRIEVLDLRGCDMLERSGMGQAALGGDELREVFGERVRLPIHCAAVPRHPLGQ